MTRQRQLYDSLIDAFYKSLRRRDFETGEDVIRQLRTGHSDELQYPLWADYFAGIMAEERDRDWAAADACYRRVLAADADGILRAHVLLSRGVAYKNQARWQAAIDSCRESAATWDDLGYPVRQAVVLRQQAITCKEGYLTGDLGPDALDEAVSLCRQVLDTLERQLVEPAEIVFYEPDLALYIGFTWSELGNIEVAAGNLDRAADYQQRFLTFCQARDDRYHAAHAFLDLGNVYQLRGEPADWDRAEANYQHALSMFRNLNESYYEFYVLASLASLAARRGELDQARTQFHDAIALIETLRSGVSSADARSGFAATVANIYAKAILTDLDAGDHARAFDCMEQARARAFLDSLHAGTVEFAAQHPDVSEAGTCTLQQLQEALPEDVIVLEYFTTGLLEHHGGTLTARAARNNVLFPEPKTLLFAVSRTGLHVFDLQLSPNMLMTSHANQPVEEYLLTPQMQRALYSRLIAPVAEQLAGKRRIYVIPHGPLHHVPFHALIADDQETLLRHDGPDIIYAPSATILLRNPAQPETAHDGACLAVGYNGAGGQTLRYAEDEADYIARMMSGRALTGSTAKKETLFACGGRYETVHFSCHGHFDPTSPLNSSLLIGADETLTGQEIMDNLRLNCRLVTLSACESGFSTIQRGDELYGLLRAFMIAGAPAVLATLWRVDERSTLILAERFYEEVQAGADYGRALKAAQLYLRSLSRSTARSILARYIHETNPHQSDQRPSPAGTSQPTNAIELELLPPGKEEARPFDDPIYWAPFVLIGDPHLAAPP